MKSSIIFNLIQIFWIKAKLIFIIFTTIQKNIYDEKILLTTIIPAIRVEKKTSKNKYVASDVLGQLHMFNSAWWALKFWRSTKVLKRPKILKLSVTEKRIWKRYFNSISFQWVSWVEAPFLEFSIKAIKVEP